MKKFTLIIFLLISFSSIQAQITDELPPDPAPTMENSKVELYTTQDQSCFHIEVKNGVDPTGSISIYDSEGTLVETQKCASTVMCFDIAKYEKGLYTARVVMFKETLPIKLIVD